MTDILPADPFNQNPPNVWLTSFWDFRPDSCGFLGFSQEVHRRSFLEKSRPECLVVVYVTKTSSRARELRGKIAGFLQVTREIGLASKFMHVDAYVTKEHDPEMKKRWNFGVRAIRAWRVEGNSPPLINEIAPKTYGSAHPRFIAGRGVPFDATEALKLRDIKVFEVPVFQGN